VRPATAEFLKTFQAVEPGSFGKVILSASDGARWLDALPANLRGTMHAVAVPTQRA
jgi:hypothetical protein